MNIRIKFTLAALIAALAPLAGYFAISYEESKAQVESQVKDSFYEATSNSVQQLDDWLTTNKSAIKAMGSIPDLTKADAKGKIELSNAIKYYPWVRAAFVTDEKGQQVLRSDAEKMVAVGDRPYFIQAKGKEGFGKQLIVSRVTNKPSLILANPLDKSVGDGIAAFAIDLGPISTAVVATDKSKSKDGSAALEQRFIVTPDGKFLAHTIPSMAEPTKEGALADAASHPLWAVKPTTKGAMGFARYQDATGKAWFGAIKQSDIGWYTAVEIPEDIANQPLESMQQRAIIAFSLASAFAILVATLAGGLLARPILSLTKITEAIGSGNFDDSGLNKIRSKDEIGELAQSIKRLSSSVKIAMQAMARK